MKTFSERFSFFGLNSVSFESVPRDEFPILPIEGRTGFNIDELPVAQLLPGRQRECVDVNAGPSFLNLFESVS